MKDARSRFNVFALAGSHSVNSIYNRVLVPVLPLIVADFGLGYAQAGLVASFYSAGNSLFQVPFSFLADYTGRRRTLLVLSLLVNALPVYFYGLAGSFPLLLALVFLSGAGSSAYHPPAVSLMAEEAPARRGLALGLFKAGGDFGSIFTPALMGWATLALGSWRTAAQFFVLPGLLCAVLIGWRFRDAPARRGKIGAEARATYRGLFRKKALRILLVVSSCRVMSLRGIMTILPLLLAESFGFSVAGVGWLLTGYFVLGTASSVVLGRLSDRFRHTTFVTGMLAVSTLGLALVPWADGMWGLILPLALVGATLSPSQGLMLAVMTEIAGERDRTSSVGLLYGINEAAGALSPFVGGLVAQEVGLQNAFLFYAVICLAGTAASLLVPRAWKGAGAGTDRD